MAQSRQLKEARRDLMKRELKTDMVSSLTLEYLEMHKNVHGPCRASHLLARLSSPISLRARAR